MRILILAPWAFRTPRNGGQLRADAIVKAYQAAGHEIYSAGFFDPSNTPAQDVGPTDIPLTQDVVRTYLELPAEIRLSEMSWWTAVAAAPGSFNAFVAAVRNAAPDVLQFEEIALWPVVKRLKQEGHLEGVRIIHSSYNFETLAWRHRNTAGSSVTSQTLEEIAGFERDVSNDCDLIVAVSEGDAREFTQLGAKTVCVAPNGVAPNSVATRSSTSAGGLSAYLAPQVPYALFVSSAHPPNAHGFVDVAARADGHPLRSGEIIVCGKVGSLIRKSPQFGKAGKILERCRFLGWVDDAILGELYAQAKVVILPKIYSGGSNLKTAEAVASGRPIVATRLAFEGFESSADLPGVAITDDPKEFWGNVDVFMGSEEACTLRTPESIGSLLWRNCLQTMVEATAAVVSGKSPAGTPGSG